MAYMSKEHAKTIRTNLKKKFPNIKFSVKIHHNSSINVSLMKSNLDFTKDIAEFGGDYVQLNHYYLERYAHADVLEKIFDVINEGNFNKSDIMTDYFHIGFYVNMNVGQYDKPYICTKLK